jgi:hypothetical protein
MRHRTGDTIIADVAACLFNTIRIALRVFGALTILNVSSGLLYGAIHTKSYELISIDPSPDRSWATLTYHGVISTHWFEDSVVDSLFLVHLDDQDELAHPDKLYEMSTEVMATHSRVNFNIIDRVNNRPHICWISAAVLEITPSINTNNSYIVPMATIFKGLTVKVLFDDSPYSQQRQPKSVGTN